MECLTKCAVCRTQNSEGHNHYGSNSVCSSCRNFFRRSVLTKNYLIFKCIVRVDGKGCKIESKERQSCKKCRFEKCLEAGMKPSWVLSGESSRSPSPKADNVNSGPVVAFTDEELKLVHHLKQTFNEVTASRWFTLFVDDIETVKMWYPSFLQGATFPFEAIQKMDQINLFVLRDIGLHLLSVEDLNSYELSVLVQCNAGKINAYTASICNAFSTQMSYFKDLIEFGQKNEQHTGVKDLLPVLQDLDLVRPDPEADLYASLFSSPWAPHSDIERQHSELGRTIAKWVKTSNEKEADFLQLLLLNMMIFLSTEDTNFDARQKAKVEAIQLKYTLMYHRYLKWAHPKTCRFKFVGGLMLLQQAKQLCQLSSLRLPV